MKTRFWLTCILILAFLPGCGPSEQEIAMTLTSIYDEVLATQAAQFTPTPTIGVGSIRYTPDDGAFMVYVPGGQYTLGSTPEEAQAAFEECEKFYNHCEITDFENEFPQHQVTIDSFWMDQTEVTNDRFAAFVAASGYVTTAERLKYASVYAESEINLQKDINWQHPDDPEGGIQELVTHPVVDVSWYDAWAYCEWAGKRLPTEAEWEAAARGPQAFLFPWGDSLPTGQQANLADVSAAGTDWRDKNIDDGWAGTAPVGIMPEGASPFQVFDMAGNVSEWVYDGYAASYTSVPDQDNPFYKDDSGQHVTKGGSFKSLQIYGGASRRVPEDGLFSANTLGFRCVQSELALPAPGLMPPIPQGEITLLTGKDIYVWTSPVEAKTIGELNNSDTANVHVLAQYDNCYWLKISSPESPEGWIGGYSDSDKIVLYPACSDLEEIFFRPKNGAGIWANLGFVTIDNEKKMMTGYGVLTVVNSMDEDVYIALQSQDNLYGWYLHGGDQATFSKILDGTYEVFYTSGTTWVNYQRQFKDATTYAKLTDPLVFTTNLPTYTKWTLTLKPIQGGNTSAIPVDPADFP
jgi:sulfatase modifying factor 1